MKKTSLLVLMLCPANLLAQYPNSLKAALELRKSWNTAQIDYMTTHRLQNEDVISFHRNTIAGDDVAYIYLGNENHVTAKWDKDEDGIVDELVKDPMSALFNGRYWYNMGTKTSVSNQKPNLFLDYRDLGLSPRVNENFDKFSERCFNWKEKTLPDGSYVVSANLELNENQGVVNWYLDKNNNVVRSEIIGKENIVLESVSITHSLVGGVYIPTNINHAIQGNVLRDVSLFNAVVNDSSLPDYLVPEYINVEVGFTIFDKDKKGTILFYGGDGRIMSEKEVREEWAYHWPTGPKKQAIIDNIPLPIDIMDSRDIKLKLEEFRQLKRYMKNNTDSLDEWDIYVAKFIKKYKLDEPRLNKSNLFLKVGKQQRDRILKKYRTRNSNASTIKKCLAKVDIVFEQMKKRLDGLLTRKEKEQSTSKPPK